MKNKVIAIVVGAVLVLGGGYYAYTKFSGKSAYNSEDFRAQESTKETDSTNTKGVKGTFASVVARGENLMCTFEYNDGTNITSGTIYIADSAKRIRGDFNIEKSAAGSMQATLIRVDGYNHIWSSSLTQGVKVKVAAEEESRLFSGKDGGLDENTEFDCKSWTLDSSKFTLPAGVNFMDASAQMPQVK